MKKALSSLPGNSVSTKKDSKDKKKQKKAVNTTDPSPKMPARRGRGPLPAEPLPPIPPDHPISPGIPAGPPPPIPSGASRPTFQRLGPPIPSTPRPAFEEEDQDTYEGMGYGDQDNYEGMGYGEGPDDVYDSVDPDEIAEISGSLPQSHSANFVPPSPNFGPRTPNFVSPPPSFVSPPPSFVSPPPSMPPRYGPPSPQLAPPPPLPPPGAEGYSDDDDQPIYDDGVGDDDDSFDDNDSFESSDPEDDYDQPPLEEGLGIPQQPNDRSRLTSDANIRSIMGKFYAHGVLKEQAGLLATKGASSLDRGGGMMAPPPPGPPPDDQDPYPEIDEDIYDCVPDEVKDMMMAAGEEEIIDEDIYDVPPDPEALQAFSLPPMKPAIVNSFHTGPPPPPEAPPIDDGDIIDEDVYDVPSEVLEEEKLQVNAYRLPLPPTNELGFPPGRPPKPMNQNSPSLPPKQPVMVNKFSKPPMRNPIMAAPSPVPPPPMAEPLPVRPPKPEPTVAPPPPPLPEEDTSKTNGVFNRPKLRAPMDKSQSSGPPLRPSSSTKPPINRNVERSLGDSITDTLSRLSPAANRHTKPPSPQNSPMPSPTLKRKESPDLPPMGAPPPPPGPPMKHNLKPVPDKTPPTIKMLGPPPTKKEDTPKGAESPTSRVAKVTKPPPATKSSAIADRMKMFQDKKSAPPSGLKGLKFPPKPAANKSPLSGRKIDKKANVNDLLSKFGGRGSMTSPVSDRSSPSPEERPNLPSKPSGSSSPKHPPWKQKEAPPKDPVPLLPSKPPVEPSSPQPARAKRWPSPEVEETKRASPLLKRKFEPPAKVVDPVLPPKRDSPVMKKDSPTLRRKLPSDSDEEKRPFVYKNFRKSKDEPDPTPPPPPREPDPIPSLPPRPQGGSPFLPPRASEPRLPEPAASLPPRAVVSSPSLPPRRSEPAEPPASQLHNRSLPSPSIVPGPSLGGPRLPDRPPPSGGPRLPDRNPPNRPPFSPPSDTSLPPRSAAQQTFPPLPTRQPPGELAPIMPSRPPRSIPHGSPVGQTWYHGNLDRKKSETRLKKYSKDGTFIIRDSSKVEGEYSLSIFHTGGVRHLRIRLRRDRKFVLGEEKADEVAFDTVIALVEFHKKEPLHLKSGGDSVLKFECPR
ncbi:uncharacterized protein LOC135330878 isoform X2 [Halichondria panicea]